MIYHIMIANKLLYIGLLITILHLILLFKNYFIIYEIAKSSTCPSTSSICINFKNKYDHLFYNYETTHCFFGKKIHRLIVILYFFTNNMRDLTIIL